MKFNKRGALFKVAKRSYGQPRQVMSAAALLEPCPMKWASMRHFLETSATAEICVRAAVKQADDSA